ncbi:MAG: hypothetical protein ACRDPC_09640 [Solirubrobacteraceae bacterium]
MLVRFADWLPRKLISIGINWARLWSKVSTGARSPTLAIPDRRAGFDRRAGTDRRTRQIPVRVERRSSHDRRKHGRRRTTPVIMLSP